MDFDTQNNSDVIPENVNVPCTYGLEVVFQRDKNVEVFGDD